ncbi:MAG TPA: trypsin-like peptidase domain-containing protein [Hanamia sp.]|nr:trypsin-like peptidase domain-containing protein [Hanamia sp.]
MKNFILLLAFYMLGYIANAQIKRIATSSSTIASQIPGYSEVTTITTKTYSYTPSIPVPPPTPIDDDSTTEDDKVYRYADILPVTISIADGNITSTTLGKVWTLRLSIPNALNIGLSFSQFNLSATAQMYIFNDARTVLDSGIIKSKFSYSTTVGISPFSSNAIIIYIIEPGNSGAFQSSISIQNLEAGFQPLYDVGNNGKTFSPASINCDPMIMCRLDKMNSARAVAVFESNGYQGTGTLITDENNDGRGFFLTAFHVVDVNDNHTIDASEIAALANARFQFQFWTTTCNGTIISTGIQFSGATVRASSHASDVILLELLNPPGIGDGVNYVGWNRGTSSPSNTNSYIIHHPQGEDMRITSTNNVRTWLYNSSFWTAHYSSGTTAPGSSGSALINENDQIVGQLKGGWSSCNYTSFGDRYGKFSTSWGGANLQQWLSPNHAYSAVSSLILSPLIITGSDALNCTGQNQYSVPNLLDATYTWQVSSNLQITSGQGTPSIGVTSLGGSNSAIITATINTPTKGYSRTLTVTKNIMVGIGNVNNFTFVQSGPTCMQYNNESMSFGVAYNGHTGCDLKDYANITGVDWQIFCPNPYTVTYNSGAYTCITPSYVNNAGISIAFSYPNQPYVITFRFRVQNACGWSQWSPGYYQTIKNCNSTSGVTVSPNPASNSINVALSPATVGNKLKSLASSITQIQVTDKIGTIIKEYKYDNAASNRTLDISGLKLDVYFIKVFDGSQWQSTSFIKQ